jgi:hypothetical protein
MQEIPEFGCEKCGAALYQGQTVPVDIIDSPPTDVKCGRCNHRSAFPVRFWWTGGLHLFVLGRWPDLPMKELRINPAGFVNERLNPWLAGQGKSRVVVETAGKALKLRWSDEA